MPLAAPTTSPHRRSSVARRAVMMALLALPSGCGPSGPGLPTAPAGTLPEELARLIPADTQVYSEAIEGPVPYKLWLFHRPGGLLLDLPRDLPGLERHDLPGTVLDGLFAPRVPRLDRGNLRGVPCRLAHWSRGDAEFQVREATTDRGWFAAVEQIPGMKEPSAP